MRAAESNICHARWHIFSMWWFCFRQLGGTFVIAKGGDTLLDFRQSNFGDHLSNIKILEALGLDTAAAMPE